MKEKTDKITSIEQLKAAYRKNLDDTYTLMVTEIEKDRGMWNVFFAEGKYVEMPDPFTVNVCEKGTVILSINMSDLLSGKRVIDKGHLSNPN